MRNYLSVTVVLLGAVLSGFSQSPQTTAPVKWERYSVSGAKITLLLPKVPIRIDSNDPCSERKSSTYWAYAESSVYTIKVVSKQSGVTSFCRAARKFGKEQFDDEMKTLAAAKDVVVGTADVGTYRNVPTFSSPLRKKYVFDEVSKGRWIELEIVARKEDNELEKRFVSSLELGGKEKGINIRDGARATIGDPYDPPSRADAGKATVVSKVVVGQGNGQGDEPAEKSSTASPLSPLVIVGKPHASYTDAARLINVQGTVILRVTFLPNGSVGSIIPVKTLPSGLTEQSIASARKMVFLPARINDTNVAVTKQVEYSFRIY